MLAGRLRGRAQKIAMNLRLVNPLGEYDVGDAALVRLSVDEVLDPLTGQVIQHAIPSGVQALLNALRSAFGEAEQLQATKAMETFFEFKRGRLPLPEWSVQWQLNYEEAVDHSGLEVNQVAKTYLYFKSSQLLQKAVDDILLQVHGDMRRFEEVRTLLLRMAHRTLDNHTVHYEDSQQYYMDEDDNGSWSTMSDRWTDQSWEHYMNDELYNWYETEYAWDYNYDPDYEETDPWGEQTWYESGWNEEPDEPQAAEPSEEPQQQEFFKGKGKGGKPSAMGLGCHVCGSKWHNAASCPIGDNQQRFNKGKNKGKGKGKSWNKGYFPRKGYGKSKGFGKKGYPHGGKYGKRNFMQDEMPASFNDYYGGSYLTNTEDKPNMQKDTVRIVAESPEKQEELLDGKKVRFDDKVEYNNGDGAQAGVAKKLNFPSGTTESMDSYHMVRGCRVCGLLVDPGASSGLVGTDTLNELLNSGMVPSGRQDEVIFGPSSTTVTGISGQSDSTLAQVTLPFDLAWRRSSTSKLHRRLDWLAQLCCPTHR